MPSTIRLQYDRQRQRMRERDDEGATRHPLPSGPGSVGSAGVAIGVKTTGALKDWCERPEIGEHRVANDRAGFGGGPGDTFGQVNGSHR
jgi:hypothetical protein